METLDPASFFIFYKPKDIVSGDFYYALSYKNPITGKETFYISAADCTGHGVPGAFMSMLGISSLNEAILEKNIFHPSEILDDIRTTIVTSLNPEGSDEEAKDGMDCVLCAYNFDDRILHFAAANNPLWLVRNGQLTEYRSDKMPVGKYGDEELLPFTHQIVELKKGDTIYIFTDGFADQFGGPKGKKFKYKQLEEKIMESHKLLMEEQKKNLAAVFEKWKGNFEQVDDVLVIGVKI